MNNKIGLITDVHANLEALKAVLIDLKSKGVKTIYSLGDSIGLGYAPKETLDLIMENNIINILGNGEAYITMGADYFPYLKRDNSERYDNAIWTSKQLTEKQIEFLKQCPNTVELTINDEKIALCHFPIDVRYDFLGAKRYGGEYPEEFLNTNTKYDEQKYNEVLQDNVAIAEKDPLFFGKTISYYDRVIYGHYHFERNHELRGTKLHCLNGTGVAITDKAIYYILESSDSGIELKRYEVPYDYEKAFKETEEIDFPNKDTFKKYINWRSI